MPEDPASPACRNFLKPIVDPENANVDLVAVHGLNPLNQKCHAEQTWIQNDKLWLRDFLPAKLPKARVLLYGYNANAAFQTSTSGVRQQADNLLNWLHLMRKGNSDRPIVFICHGLGGLVVKQALVNATNNPAYGSIRRATHGIAFFATPHRGGKCADLGRIAATIARGVLLEPKSSFLDALKKDSLFAERLRDDMTHQWQDYRVLSFYETLHFKKFGLVVDKASATLSLGGPRETMVDLEADHSGVCKFGSEESPMYERVSLNLVSLVEEAINLALERQQVVAKAASTTTAGAMTAVGSPTAFFAVPYTENPNFIGRSEILGRLRDILKPDPGKASSQVQARVALYGLGGVGKTQIAISYAYWLQEHYPQSSVFWVHASSRKRFRESYEAICRECAVPEADKPGSDHLQLLHQWLKAKGHGDWLMIIDNADDTEVLFNAAESAATDEMPLEGGRQELRLAKFIPECSHGAILVTTRNKQAGVKLTKGRALFEVDKMTPKEAEDLVTSRLADTILDPQELNTLVKSLEHLPLALIQATAFIQQESTSLSDYLKMIGDPDLLLKLLEQPFEDFGRDEEIPNPVSTTWMLSFNLIRRVNPRASELLSLMAFFDRNEIPKDLLKQAGDNEVDLQKAWGLLKAFSLITETADSSAFNVHRLIHLVVRRWHFVEHEQERWAAKALATLSEAFPKDQLESWSTCAVYIPHAMAVLDHSSKSRSEQRALLLVKVSDYLAQSGNFEAAEKMKVEALTIRKEMHPPGHITTTRCMTDLALFYNNHGLYDKAVALAQHTRELIEQMHGPTHCDTLSSVEVLAFISRNQGLHEKAVTLSSQVLETKKQILGSEHPDTLSSLSFLATTYYAQERYEEASVLTSEVLEVRKRVLVPEHPDTLASMSALARIHERQKLCREAEAQNLKSRS